MIAIILDQRCIFGTCHDLVHGMLDPCYHHVPDKSWTATTGSSSLSLLLLVHPQLLYINKGEHDGVDYWHEICVYVEGQFSLGPEDTKALSVRSCCTL